MKILSKYTTRPLAIVVSICVFCLIDNFAVAQELEWAKRAGGVSGVLGYDIAVDALANSYVTGSFSGSATFGVGEVNETILTSTGSGDIFVAKYDATGSLLWVKQAGGLESDGVFGIAVDDSGNSYVTGTFRGSATFGIGEVNETLLLSAGDDDIFLAKYDVNGNLSWAKQAGSTTSIPVRDIAVDASGNSYITGGFRDPVTFGSGEANETILTGAGSTDVFVASYDTDGAFVWAKHVAGDRYSRGLGIAVDNLGNSYVTGYFYGGPAIFGPGEANETILTNIGGRELVFVARYGSNGELLWAKQTSGNADDYANVMEGNGTGIAVDELGNSYITGFFEGIGIFGPGEPNETILTSASPEYGDVFVAGYASDGSLLWAHNVGGISNDEGTDIAVDESGDVYATGFFRDTVTFGAGEPNETILTNPGSFFNVYVAKYNATGNLAWVKQAGGMDHAVGSGISVDISGNAYVTGYFRGSMPLGSGEPNETILTSAGSSDVFVAKFGNTVSGSNVSIDLGGGSSTDGGATVTFSNITAGGATSYTTSESGPELPAGFSLGDPATYYDVTTSAEFSGDVEVCIEYSGISFMDEFQLKLLHYENDEWVDRTSSLDTVADIICASVTSFSFFAIVSPPPPVVYIDVAPIDPVGVGTQVSVGGRFVDKDAINDHTAEWNWGDGSSTAGDVDQSENTVAGDHTYTEPGVFTISLTVTDGSGNAESATYQYVVVYDPDGGFVTGGGWIDSPESALASQPALTGKAYFGFSSKYKKGNSVPDGETEFNFSVAGLNFHSTEYDWLVIAGPKAQFKGSGVINNAGDFGFILTATDAQLTPSTDDDLFRIKIWDKNNADAKVYDNQPGEEDESDSGSMLGGGNIVIHGGKGKASTAVNAIDELTVASDFDSGLPDRFLLEGNYPNPFNPTTSIRYGVPETAQIKLTVYDTLGRIVAVLIDGVQDGGMYEVSFDARMLPSGIYLYRLETPAGNLAKSMLLSK